MRASCISLSIAVVLMSGCGSSRPARQPADQQIRAVTDSFVALSKTEPALPGFQVAENIATTAFAGRTRADADLLVARMYYDTTSRISAGQANRWPAGGQTPNAAAVRSELANPASSTRLTSEYFDGLARDTAARTATDPAFGAAMETARLAVFRPWNQAWDDYKCTLDGEPWPMTFCRTAWIFNWTDKNNVLIR